MFDVPALLIVLLLVLLLLVLGETARSLFMGERLTLRRTPKRLVVEWHVVAIALVFLAIDVIPALIEMAVGSRSHDKVTNRVVLLAIVTNFVILASVIPLLAVTGRNRLADSGISLRDFRTEVKVGGLGYLVATPLVMAVIFAMNSWRGPETEHPFLKLLENGSNGTLVSVAIAAVVAAPLAEELVFRVLFQGLLESLVPPAVAILVPAVAFAARHGKYDALPLLPLAIVLGTVYYLRRSYVAIVIIHAMFNATFLLLALSARELS